MFNQRGSQQANAAPLQSFIKHVGVQKTPWVGESQKSGFTPRPKPKTLTSPVMPSEMNVQGYEPLFLALLAKHFMNNPWSGPRE